ncbi:MAG: sirohydrochlorin cobaltochelatase [Schwartzia sp.]|nr:sirohydrochlorin cobaltochelatase [Schwartzia sp. (in: firmicutes)]
MLVLQGNCHAKYIMHPEVRNVTMALRHATQIGVLCYDTPELQGLPDKDAILVMSFGTTVTDARRTTIEKTVEEIQQNHPDVKVVLAFTSNIVIERIAEREGKRYPMPEEALHALKAEGYTRVAMTTLDLFPGIEYTYDTSVFHLYKAEFKRATMGTPLIYWMGQHGRRDDAMDFVKAVETQFPVREPHGGVLLMAHGSPHPSNAFYDTIQSRLMQMGFRNVYVYTVEGRPNLSDVVPYLKRAGVQKITLMPLMMVAGTHVKKDMMADNPQSHKVQLEAAGFEVNPYLKGLGENEAVRRMYVERADEAYEYLKDSGKK